MITVIILIIIIITIMIIIIKRITIIINTHIYTKYTNIQYRNKYTVEALNANSLKSGHCVYPDDFCSGPERFTIIYYNKHRASEVLLYIGGRGLVSQIIEPVTFARCAFIIALRNIALDGYLDTRRNI